MLNWLSAIWKSWDVRFRISITEYLGLYFEFWNRFLASLFKTFFSQTTPCIETSQCSIKHTCQWESARKPGCVGSYFYREVYWLVWNSNFFRLQLSFVLQNCFVGLRPSSALSKTRRKKSLWSWYATIPTLHTLRIKHFYLFFENRRILASFRNSYSKRLLIGL